MFDFATLRSVFPERIYASVEENLDFSKMWEIRMRAERPAAVWYDGREYFLTRSGLTEDGDSALTCSSEDIRACVMGAAEHSVYAYNDDISSGYITLSGGIRMGICGEVVTDGGKILTVKNYSSVNIRFPHEIPGISKCIMPEIVSKPESILVLAPPGGGKTTVLRDIARRLSDEGGYNVLIADERAEIAGCRSGVPGMNVGLRTDVITGSRKSHVFECALRSIRPDVIVTDELFGRSDGETVREAMGSGIAVVASAHASSPESFVLRELYAALGDAMDRFCYLSRRGGKLISSDISHCVSTDDG